MASSGYSTNMRQLSEVGKGGHSVTQIIVLLTCQSFSNLACDIINIGMRLMSIVCTLYDIVAVKVATRWF